MTGIYVHVPFCERKCLYCDFYSIVVSDREQFCAVVDNYLSAVQKEAQYYKEQVRDCTFETIFIGGGTPTLLPPDRLGGLIVFLRSCFSFVQEPEITVEANPNTLTHEMLTTIKEAGVNRISLGAQAFQDRLLAELGRTHGAADIAESVEMIQACGIENFNLDLIYGLPNQSPAHWEESLREAVNLQPTHLSCYSLIVEEGTPFFRLQEQGLLNAADDDLQARMYDMTRKILVESGYCHYEISNFCRPYYEARHNLLYWLNEPFLGLGSGATGYLNRVRYTNVPSIEKYIDGWSRGEPHYSSFHKASVDQEMDETMMVGMRLLAGVSDADFRNRFGSGLMEVYGPQIQELLKRGLVEFKDGVLSVTERGLYLENLVSGAFLREAD